MLYRQENVFDWIHCGHHQSSVWRWKRYTGIRLALQSDVFDTFLLLLSTFRTFFCSGPLLLLCRMKLSQPKLFWPFTKSMNYSIWLLKIMPEILKCTKYAAESKVLPVLCNRLSWLYAKSPLHIKYISTVYIYIIVLLSWHHRPRGLVG